MVNRRRHPAWPICVWPAIVVSSRSVDGGIDGGHRMERAEPVRLLRVLGVAFGIAAVIGGTIGQGILRSPGLVASGVPDATAIMALWAVVGGFCAIDAMSTVELAASIRKTGGPYTFARRAFGPFVGLTVGLTDWVSNIGAIAYVAVVLGEYLHRMGIAVEVPIGGLAAGLPLALGAIQLAGTKVSGRSQELGSVVKTALFAVLIATLLFSPRGSPVLHPVPPAGITALGLVTALRAVTGTYNGWNGAAYFGEETVNPARTIARATFMGIALVTGLYLLTNFAFLRMLSPAQMVGDNLVAASAMAQMFGARADFYVTSISTISLITVANMTIMMFTRVLFAIARDRQVPVLSGVAANGTPRAALIVTEGAGAMLASIGAFEVLLAFSTALYAAMLLSVNLAAVVLRRREPDLARPYRMPFFPLPALIAAAGTAALLTAFTFDDPSAAAARFGLMLAMTALVQLAVRAGGRTVSV